MDKDELVRRLMATFLGELEERIRAFNADLVALEKGPAEPKRTQLVQTLFRTAHSLKGAARSVGLVPLEGACHRLEEVLAGVRDGRIAPGPALFEVLYATADALAEAGRRVRAGEELTGAPLAAVVARLEGLAREPGGTVKKGAPAEPPAAASAPAAAPAPAPAPVAPPLTEGFVRVPAPKLDALLVRGGELLVARRRVEGRLDELRTLHDFVARWEADWRRGERPLRALLRPTGPDAEGEAAGPSGGRRPGAPGAARRALHVLDRTRANLDRLERDLDRLATAAVADGRALAQAAGALEDETRGVRMLPFVEACSGLERAVRDLAAAADKLIDLVLEGGAVEIDRSILEELKDPLLHLVRNAVDHGIEPAAERAAAGKPARARITVTATLHAGQVEVAVGDDGRGLDIETIRTEARRRHLPEPETPAALARLIFLPGFSTARLITEVSGRGVGLDVVKHRVEALHGSVDLAFKPGRGTRFVLTLPLTLTTVRALLVAAGGQTFAFLGTNVRGLRRVGAADLRPMEGRDTLLVGGTPVPVALLAETLGLPPREPLRPGSKAPAVLVAAGERQAAFLVDELLAEQEVVVKGLGPRLVRVRHFAGATILPTGRVALLLHAADLVASALGRAPVRPIAAALAAAPPETRKRLLVVDDSVTTRTLVKTLLEAAGYDVTAASDGDEAWRVLQEQGADLVVADIEMPRMDGFALTEAIRAAKRFRDLPVVLVTALESEADKARGLAAGADAYLRKSAFDQRTLLETIAQLV